jgi:hypothetical protein
VLLCQLLLFRRSSPFGRPPQKVDQGRNPAVRRLPEPAYVLDARAVYCHADCMTRAAKKLLEEFDSLSDADRAEVTAAVLRRLASSPHGLPDDGDLTAAADQVFLQLDQRESAE